MVLKNKSSNEMYLTLYSQNWNIYSHLKSGIIVHN